MTFPKGEIQRLVYQAQPPPHIIAFADCGVSWVLCGRASVVHGALWTCFHFSSCPYFLAYHLSNCWFVIGCRYYYLFYFVHFYPWPVILHVHFYQWPVIVGMLHCISPTVFCPLCLSFAIPLCGLVCCCRVFYPCPGDTISRR